jgi:ABC-2 type transport system permease protein
MRTVFTKSLYQRRWMLLFWSLAAAAMACLPMAFFESFMQGGALEELLATLPEQIRVLVGDPAQLRTIGGYVDSQIFAMRVPMVTVSMAIALMVGLTAGEEHEGVLQTALTLPISRSRLMVEKYLAGLALLGVAHVAVLGGLLLGMQFTEGSHPFGLFAGAALNCWVLSAAFGSVAFLMGAGTGRRGLALGVASLVAIGDFLVHSLAQSSERLEAVGRMTLFHAYSSPRPVVEGLAWSNVLALVSLSVVLVVVANFLFARRDLRH